MTNFWPEGKTVEEAYEELGCSRRLASKRIPFNSFRDVPPDRIDEVIASLTDTEWNNLDDGYLQVAAAEIRDWWPSYLGLHDDVDAAALFCTLYPLALARTTGA